MSVERVWLTGGKGCGADSARDKTGLMMGVPEMSVSLNWSSSSLNCSSFSGGRGVTRGVENPVEENQVEAVES